MISLSLAKMPALWPAVPGPEGEGGDEGVVRE